MMYIPDDLDNLNTLKTLAESQAQLLEWQEVYQSIGDPGARKKFVQIVADLAEKGSAEAQRTVVVDDKTAIAWAKQFREDLSAIAADLPLRTYHALFRALHTYVDTVASPSARGYYDSYERDVVDGAFSVGGALLSFDEWCEAVQTGKVNVNELAGVRLIGSKGLDAIRLAAIKHNQRRQEMQAL